MSAPDANGWVSFDATKDPGTGGATVDLWLPLSGRLTDCAWASGRKAWIRSTKHGVEEILTAPTHWRQVPEGPVPISLKIMDINAPKGTMVIFADRNGYESQREYARRFLSKGFAYTVEKTEAEDSYATVELQEFPGKQFNTVMFWAQT